MGTKEFNGSEPFEDALKELVHVKTEVCVPASGRGYGGQPTYDPGGMRMGV
ncbi:hypothetical protein [Pasteuria penetrans]|uniref:hypothetical protein n=1 Tax=Pasteuria penetrans TaxID=86005 RepID=UPI000FA5759E|nr:hypothetical protein [Pasteuria penetrans]